MDPLFGLYKPSVVVTNCRSKYTKEGYIKVEQ